MEKNIVISYLEKKYQDLFEIKLNVEKELYQRKSQLENNKKIINKIEESLENSLESFSPRKSNQENHDKIKSLTKEQNILEEEICSLEKKLKKSELNLEEMDAVLKAEREDIKSIRDNTKSLKKTREHYKKMIETQDLERQRMAKQLYNKMVQNYDYMIHKIEVCSRLVNVDKMASHKALNQMADYMKESMQNMLQIVYDVPFFPIKEIDVEDIIQNELMIIEDNDIMVSFSYEGDKMELPLKIKLAVIKIMKESCNNILCHANAKNVNVKLYYNKDAVCIKIEDDGIGFEKDVLAHKYDSGIGISIMEERTYLLNGKFEINSKLNKGTEIIAEIPVVF